MKEHFEVLPFCSSKYSDKNINTLSRITNTYVEAMNSKFYLPEVMIIFLDADLIEFLQYKRYNLASLLGPWIEHLSQFFAETIQERHQLLPSKARNKEITQIYWVEPVNHGNFDYIDQQAREILSKCLEVNCKVHENMRVLKLREFWNKNDDVLVINNRLTRHGLAAYWKSVDASLKFNLKKREEFMVRNKFRAMKPKLDDRVPFSVSRKNKNCGQSMSTDLEDDDDHDDMRQFFARHRSNFNGLDWFHWRNNSFGSHNRSPQFILPSAKNLFQQR